MLSCQSVNSSAQLPCWLPLGQRANKQMWTERGSGRERAARPGGWGGRWGEFRHDFCFWFYPPTQPSRLTSWMKGRKNIQAAVQGTGSAQWQLNSSHCGEHTIEGQEPQMPNTSTAGHSLKGNPPPTNPHPLHMLTHIHSKEGEKKGSPLCFGPLDFIWKNHWSWKCSFSDFSSPPLLFLI